MVAEEMVENNSMVVAVEKVEDISAVWVVVNAANKQEIDSD